MSSQLPELFAVQGGVASAGQLISLIGRAAFDTAVARGSLGPVWTGIYSLTEPDAEIRLRGLDLRAGTAVPICLGTAAAAYGFDTEATGDLHVLTPDGHQLRRGDGLVIHRREGAPLTVLDGRPITEASWTAIEVARSLRRPRALATLDAALRTGTCDSARLSRAARAQKGRRGIVTVRDLIPLASPLAESPMESESRLRMHDGGLPAPVLQYEIVDRYGRLWRVDFAWPDRWVIVEYDSLQWHSDPAALEHDRIKRAALEDLGYTVISINADDVRQRPFEMVHTIRMKLAAEAA
ncbi:MAG: DUF559 domain-containing protein [Mycobacterium sp.]|nr:DUF559 domain-containing protein [Mycobacterium sp.]